jgi:hypothetical protein
MGRYQPVGRDRAISAFRPSSPKAAGRLRPILAIDASTSRGPLPTLPSPHSSRRYHPGTATHPPATQTPTSAAAVADHTNDIPHTADAKPSVLSVSNQLRPRCCYRGHSYATPPAHRPHERPTDCRTRAGRRQEHPVLDRRRRRTGFNRRDQRTLGLARDLLRSVRRGGHAGKPPIASPVAAGRAEGDHRRDGCGRLTWRPGPLPPRCVTPPGTNPWS